MHPAGISADIVRLSCQAMGTRFECVLSGADPVRLRAAGEAALHEIRAMDERLSAFRPDSAVGRINAHAHARSAGVDRETMDLLALCLEVWRASDGAFDVTIGPLMHAWGFRGPRGDVAQALARTGMQHLALDPAACTVRLNVPGMALDLGAVGKGAALDAAAGILRDAGVPCGFVHGGTSSAIALGAPPGLPGWSVSLACDPPQPRAVLRDAALSVSAPRGRVADAGDGFAGHLLDPSTGRPVASVSMAACIHSSAAVADAWSTAVLVLAARGKTPAPPAELAWLVDQTPFGLGAPPNRPRPRFTHGGAPTTRFQFPHEEVTA